MRSKKILNLLSSRGRKPHRNAGSQPYPSAPAATQWRVEDPGAAVGDATAARSLRLIPALEDVFKTSAVEVLASKLSISPDELMAVLSISGRTAQRRWQEGVLTLDESDRLYRVARIFGRAIDVFEAETPASSWLKREQALFSGHAPLALLGSDAGAKAVEDQLGRIDHGIFA